MKSGFTSLADASSHFGGLNQSAAAKRIEHLIAENRILQPSTEVGKSRGAIDCRSRLGSTLRYYHRKAA
jgi:hypothetical protein